MKYLNISKWNISSCISTYHTVRCDKQKKNKNLYGRDGRTICGPQCVPKSTSVTLAVDEKSLPMATITGRTDRRTDRVRRNMRPPPREEGRIIKHRNSIMRTQCKTTKITSVQQPFEWGKTAIKRQRLQSRLHSDAAVLSVPTWCCCHTISKKWTAS